MNRDKAMLIVNRFAYCVVMGIVGIISTYLFVQGLFTDIRIDKYEICYFIESNLFVSVVALLFMIALFYTLHNYLKLSDKAVIKLVLLMSTLCVFFVLISLNKPRTDQWHILETASEIWQGNYSSLEAGNYLDIYPHQYGIVLFAILLCIIGGGQNYVIFQILNAAAIATLYYSIYKFWKNYRKNDRTDEIVLALVLFIPMIFYVNFVYGTIIGFVLAIEAVLQQQIYLAERKNQNAIFSVVLIVLACVFKTNYSIFLIGILLVYLFDCFGKANWKNLCIVAGMLLLFALANNAVIGTMMVMTEQDHKESNGIPKLAWVVMGLQESYKAPGWFNGYNVSVYKDANYNTELATQACIRALHNEIINKVENPMGTVEFFRKKITSIWCDSSFGCFYNNRIDAQNELLEHSRLYNDAVVDTGKLHKVLLAFMDGYQSFIYLGTVFYIWKRRKPCNFSEIVGLLIFTGGFIFYLFWEGKSSYALMFFPLLIPYSIKGYEIIFESKNSCRIHNCDETIGTAFVKKGLLLALAMAVIVTGQIIKINDSCEAWDQYCKEHRFVDSGCYYLKTMQNNRLCTFGESQKLYLSLDSNDTWQYQFDDVNRESRLAVIDDNVVMVENGNTDFLSDAYWRWRIERLSGGYCIRWWNDMNKVFTYDEENNKVYLSDYEEGNINQIFKLERY